jgi:hypothetical protein
MIASNWVGAMAALALGTAINSAMAAEIICPDSIKVAEKADLPQDNAWQILNVDPDQPHRFYEISFSTGSPVKMASLTPIRSVNKKTQKIEIYTFSKRDREPPWISCLYHDTSVVVARPIPEPHDQCEVTYDPLTGFASVKKVECH